MHLYECVHMYVYKFVNVPTCVWTTEVHMRCHPPSLSPCFLRQELSLNMKLSSSARLASETLHDSFFTIPVFHMGARDTKCGKLLTQSQLP